jgi:WD40 repeat protein
MNNEFNFKYAFALLISSLFCLAVPVNCPAVTTKITKQATGADFLKGQTENVVVGSLGTVSLGQAAQTLTEKLDNEVWSINSIVISGPTVFIGTSPNGGIYKYSLGELTQIYPLKSADDKDDELLKSPDSNNPQDVKSKQYLANEHVYAMATDVSGRLLAAVSGTKCRLIRFEAGKTKGSPEPKTVFEPNDTRYIFAITLDTSGNIYLATGPKGKIYKLDSFAKNAKVIYESRQKNILSLTVGKDGFLYAGTDGHGIIYKIDPRKEATTVLYDSQQDEIASLLFLPDSENLYAAATSAQITSASQQFKGQLIVAGRPETVVPEKTRQQRTETPGAEYKKGRRRQRGAKRNHRSETSKADQSKFHLQNNTRRLRQRSVQ